MHQEMAFKYPRVGVDITKTQARFDGIDHEHQRRKCLLKFR